MSDLHRLPLLGHDLPEIAAPMAPEKIKVFKVNGQWYWHHSCGDGASWFLWRTAFYGATAHARRCC